jgi:hypothetical protein
MLVLGYGPNPTVLFYGIEAKVFTAVLLVYQVHARVDSTVCAVRLHDLLYTIS